MPAARVMWLPEIVYQDHITIFGAARERELFPVVRPIEGENDVGLEVGQLPGLSAVNGLKPDIGDAAAGVDVGDRAAIRQPSHTRGVGSGRLLQIKELHRLSTCKREEGNL